MTGTASGNVLIVEDDPGIAALQKRRLERGGYTVKTASNAEETMTRISEGGIELLTLDYGLPGGVTGLELHERIKEAGYDLPVIIVTGQGAESTIIEALRAGASDFVTKSPEYLDYLPEAVGRVLAKVRNERRLEELEQRFRATFHQAAVGIAQVDLQGRWLMANERLGEILGYTPEQLYELTLRDVLHPGDRDSGGDHARRLVEEEIQSYSEECRCMRSDGSQVWVNLTGSLVRDASGEPMYSILVVENITERKRLQEQLAYQTFYDSLTGLPNRSLFQEYLERALEHAGDGRSVSVLAVSVEDLEEINEGLGHEAGDELMAAVSERLQSCLDPEDSIASLTRSEFGILLEDIANPGEGLRTAERIADQMGIPFLIRGHKASINTSIGVVPLASSRDTPENLIRNASTAMRRARSDQTSNYAVYDEGLDERALERLRLSNELEETFERGGLEVCYEPRVRLATGNMDCIEASIRWEHPERGRISSDDLFNLAEEVGLSFRIAQHMLHEACVQMRRWQENRDSGPNTLLQVNIPSSYLQHPGLDQQLSRTLDETGLAPRTLILGIEESAAIQDTEFALTTFGEIKEVGIKLSLEDFGRGLSSLTHLERFPLDFLKLDRELTGTLTTQPAYANIIPAVIEFSHTLGLQVVAAGLDSREMAKTLRELGFDLAQGSYLAEPRPAREMEQGLADSLLSVTDEPN